MPLGEFICALSVSLGSILSGILISYWVINSDLSAGYKVFLIALAIIFSARSFSYHPDKLNTDPVFLPSPTENVEPSKK